MPELPEVETIRRGLERRVVGRSVRTVQSSDERLRWPLDTRGLRRLVGRRIESVERRGKCLIVRLDGIDWLVHLGMSGRLLVEGSNRVDGPHEHVRVSTGGGFVIVYRDPRRFGWMRFGALAEFRELRDLGPEPFDSDLRSALDEPLRRTRREVKSALLDQRVVAGLGNIYVNEVLFRSGVRPTRRGPRLRRADVARIAAAIPETIREAIDRRGTSFSDFVDASGAPGSYQLELAVFQREGEPCRRCGTPIRRIAQGNRSSFYCPRCQV